MALGLGIDTGGTYTDAVIYDFTNKKIMDSSKSITMKENLIECIGNTLNGLKPKFLSEVKAVSLSTTLATNACIEGKGGRAKLILIGCDKSVAGLYGSEYGLPSAKDIIFLDGGHDMKGNVVMEPDWAFLKQQIDLIGDSVDSYAVVEIWGMNNCDYEKYTKTLIVGMTGKKVICGHELTAKINLLKRAASALLNAQLIPLIGEFISAIKTNLGKRGIDAPIAVVRGDGSLMNETFALDHPVETLLCGPAASVEGGINLSDERECVIIDMGGTTSDMALVRNKMPRLAEEGAVVGKWRTGTYSILIETMGLGGDSRISFTDDGKITVGPERVVPLSWAAHKWPVMTEKIESVYAQRKKYFFPICEFYYLIKDIEQDGFYNHEEKEITSILKEGPIGLIELSKILDSSLIETNTERLEKYGIIGRIGLTPTDLMHITGDFSIWNKGAALTGAASMAYQLDIEVSYLLNKVYETIKEKLFLKIAKTLIEDEDKSLLKDGLSGQLSEVLLNGFRKAREIAKGRPSEEHNFYSSFTTPFALIGIGAPAHVFLKDVAEAMGTKCVIPEYAHVANAVGAITGCIRAEVIISITPDYSADGIYGYTVFTKDGKASFADYDIAVEHAKKHGRSEAYDSAISKGGQDIDVSISVMENSADVSAIGAGGINGGTMDKGNGDPGNSYDCENSGNIVLIETKITASAVGKPSW
ncbi:MAG: hydantoinase/oxoprolinase family protein [Clostridiales bacterium]|nr:hydantoinase/oxoprolinase family protein [Clostridiales bacterium]